MTKGVDKMNKEIPYIITFDSTHAAMDAEKKLISQSIKVHMIPTPRQITANCGLSIKIMGVEHEELLAVLKALKIETKALYRMESFQKIERID